MKKIFSIFAAALIVFGAASCKKSDKKSEPAPSTFTITISDITYDGCDFTITPSNTREEYMYMFLTQGQLGEDEDLVKTVEGIMAISQRTYADYKEKGYVQQDKFQRDRTPEYLSALTKYVLAVFHVNEQLKVVGDVTLSKSFYTLPNGYVDLGLPSGILWKCYEEDDDNNYPILMTYTEAAERGTVPTRKQWDELLSNCTINWMESGNYGPYLKLSGPSKRSISLFNTGKYGSDGKLADDGEYRGYYWTSTQSGSIMIQNDVFYFYGGGTKENGFGKKPYASQNVCGAILVTDNPNIVPPVR